MGDMVQKLRYLSTLCPYVPQSQYSVKNEDLALMFFAVAEYIALC